jgi:hypothetical protein
MDADGRRRFQTCLESARVYLEYGAGGSTMLASRVGVEHIYSVDSDALFLGAVRAAVDKQAGKSTLVLHRVDVGPTKTWGYPLDRRRITRWPQYSSSVWERLAVDRLTPDLVLVDGRFRVASFCCTLLHADPGTTVLFDDYAKREHYHRVEQVLRPRSQHGRMAEFEVPEALDRPRVVRLLLEQSLDTR